MAAKTALFIVAEGSKEFQLVAVFDILRRANIDMTIADVANSIYVKTESNLLTKTVAKLGDLKIKKFDAVIILDVPSYKYLPTAYINRRVLAEVEKCGGIIAPVDGDLVKNHGPAAAVEFGLHLVKVLLGNEAEEKIAKDIL